MLPVLATTRADLILLLAPIVMGAWVFAFGACIGSLVNVLVYRLPLGLDVVTPSSRCPGCETRLTWRENIPVLGWLLLRGRCRFCRSPISAEYPIVEAFAGALWVLVWLRLYSDVGRDVGLPSPAWAGMGFRESWPIFIAVLTLFSCLIAVTLIDARTFHIPMSLVVIPVGAGLVLHTGWALWHGPLVGRSPGWEWALPTPGPNGWPWVGACLGAVTGLVLSNVLLRLGVIRRSFADYDDWLRAQPGQPDQQGEAQPGQEPKDSPEMWIQYPHARREMLRELIFLAPAIGLGMAGAALAIRLAGPWGPDMTPAAQVPLWLSVLTGVLMGYLIGGGLVWGVRVLGSLAFGKEAMGLGDVHLMAAVGACLGWIDAVLGFFGAAFVGMFWAILSRLFSGRFNRQLPFGPYLAIATVLVWFCRPGIERLISATVKAPVHLP
jgi:leader peptidase (prepilin peptidase) / N-methyltransferase